MSITLLSGLCASLASQFCQGAASAFPVTGPTLKTQELAKIQFRDYVPYAAPRESCADKFLSLFPLPSSACAAELVAGVAGSVLTKSPLPMLLGASRCLPKAHAQIPVGGVFTVSTSIAGAIREFLSSASFSDGRVIAAWSSDQPGPMGRYDYSDGDVYGKIFNPLTGIVNEEFRLNNHTLGRQFEPVLAVLPNDDIAAVWSTEAGGGYSAVLRLYNSQGTPVTEELDLLQSNCSTSSSYGVGNLEVKALGNGKFVVKWQDGEPTYSQAQHVYFRTFNATGQCVGNIVKVFTTTSQSVGLISSIVTLLNDNIVVAYDEGSGVQYSVYDSTGTFLMNGTVPGNGILATTVSRSNGNFLIAKLVGTIALNLEGDEFSPNGAFLTEFTNNLPPNNGVTAMFELSTKHFAMTWSLLGFSISGRLVDESFATIGTFDAEAATESSLAVFKNDYILLSWFDQNNSVMGRVYMDDGAPATTTTLGSTPASTTTLGTSAASSSASNSTLSSSSLPTLASSSASSLHQTSSVSMSGSGAPSRTPGTISVAAASDASRLTNPLRGLLSGIIGRLLGQG